MGSRGTLRVIRRTDGGFRLDARGGWLTLPLLLLAWMTYEVSVAVDYVRDRHGAYEGKVVEIRVSQGIDRILLGFPTMEHLIIETPDGRTLDRRVAAENRTYFRIEVGDRVVKERGFDNYARVPGKPSVGDLIAAAADDDSG